MALNKRRNPERKGAATVEFAFCAPVFFMVVFAGVELARVNMLMQSVDSACVQAARRGIVPGASASDVQAVASSVLDIAGANSYTVTVSPQTITSTTDSVSVTVNVPLGSNGYITPKFFGAKSVQRTLVFTRE